MDNVNNLNNIATMEETSTEWIKPNYDISYSSDGEEEAAKPEITAECFGSMHSFKKIKQSPKSSRRSFSRMN